MKRLGRIALGLAVVVAAVAAVLAFGSELLFARLVESRLAAETGYAWTVGGRPSLAFAPELALVVRDLRAETKPGSGPSIELKADSLRVAGVPAELVAGSRLSRIELDRPVLRIPAEWWRAAPAAPRPSEAASSSQAAARPTPDKVVLRNGAVELVGPGGEVELAATGLRLDATADRAARSWAATFGFDAGGEAVAGDLTAGAATAGANGAVPVTFTVRPPPSLAGPISGSTEARIESGVVTLSNLAGAQGSNRFNGAIVVDLTAKPFVRMDLGFPALAIPRQAGSPGSGPSDARPAARIAPAALAAALSIVDGRLTLYAGRIEAAPLVASEVAIEMRLANGTTTVQLARAGLHGGELAGVATVSAANGTIRASLDGRVDGIRARPLLSDVAGFTMLDGVASATFRLQGAGSTAEDAARTVSGTVGLEVRDGRLDEVDLPALARLAAAQISGRKGEKGETTAFDIFKARFDVKDGRATTDDLALRGPLVIADGTGAVDLVGRTLAITIKPKLVGGDAFGAKLAGLGVPIVVEGPWDAPRVAPDLAGLTLPTEGLPGLDALGGLLGGGGLGGLLDALAPPPRRSSPPQRRPERPR